MVKQPLNLTFELKRKIFHVSGIIFPITYILTSKELMIVILCLATILTIIFDILRHRYAVITKIVDHVFTFLMRPEEKSGTLKLSGMSFMVGGMLITAIIATKTLAITAWLILLIADSLAALIGKKFGKPLANNKSIVGAATFWVSSIIISLLCSSFFTPFSSFLILLLSATTTTLAEFYANELKLNDNLSIPLIYALSVITLNHIGL